MWDKPTYYLTMSNRPYYICYDIFFFSFCYCFPCGLSTKYIRKPNYIPKKTPVLPPKKKKHLKTLKGHSFVVAHYNFQIYALENLK